MGRRTARALRGLGIGLGVLVAAVVGIGFGLSRTLGGVPDAPLATCDDPVPWTQADQFIGERVAIAGPVAEVSYAPDVGGRPTFVNLGAAHPDPDRFDAVLYPQVRERFEVPPEDHLPGRELCVQGEVRDRDGVPQIIVENRAMLHERP